MRLKRSLLFNIAIATFVASLIFILTQKGILQRLELSSLDFSFRLRGPISFNPHIVVVEITDSDILSIGRWPWKRSWHAAMTQALTGLGAKDIYFDIIFSENSIEEDDALLEEAIKKSKNAYFPFVFQDIPYDINNALLPLKRFSGHLKGTGSINIYPDRDGTLRRIPLIFFEKENVYPHVALKIAMDYLGLKIKETKSDYLILSNFRNELKIPLIEKNKMLINWAGTWRESFKRYTYLEVLDSYKDFLENKKPKVNLSDFKDSICLVAVTAIGLYDIKPVPLEPEYPGIGIIANTINNILNKDFLHHTPQWLNIIILYFLALMPSFLIFGEKPFKETIFVFLMGGVYFCLNFLLFKNGVRLELSYPLLGLFASYLTVETYNFVRVSVERQTFFRLSVTDGLTGLYNIRYFKMLLETEIMLARPDPTKKFSIIMSDIDHFKQFNDTYGHQVGDLVLKEAANVIKNSLRSSDIVARYGGEEMIVLLRGSILKDALGIAEKIRKNVETSLVKDQNRSYKVTISLGVSTYNPKDNVESVIKRADDGLYKAKESGRNRVCSIEVSS